MTFESKSSLEHSSRSEIWTQIYLARFRDWTERVAHDFLPSEYRSYAVDERKERARPTTKPRTVSRTVLTDSSYQKKDMQVMSVAQAPIMVNGRIMRGVTEPWRRMK